MPCSTITRHQGLVPSASSRSAACGSCSFATPSADNGRVETIVALSAALDLLGIPSRPNLISACEVTCLSILLPCRRGAACLRVPAPVEARITSSNDLQLGPQPRRVPGAITDSTGPKYAPSVDQQEFGHQVGLARGEPRRTTPNVSSRFSLPCPRTKVNRAALPSASCGQDRLRLRPWSAGSGAVDAIVQLPPVCMLLDFPAAKPNSTPRYLRRDVSGEQRCCFRFCRRASASRPRQLLDAENDCRRL